jgi:predicted GH43/DUF377 family glycosyl hydrolase
MLKNKIFYICCLVYLLVGGCPLLNALIDLNDLQQEFVLETERIIIPGYPNAFNPTIIRWKGSLILGFRDIPDPKVPFNSVLGLVKVDENFQLIGKPQLLNTRESYHGVPSRAEDARLVLVGERLYIVYSDNCDVKITKGGFRVYIAEVKLKNDKFFLDKIECLSQFEGENSQKREKNWVPFDYKGHLLLAYSLQPHLIFRPVLGKGKCETFSLSRCDTLWNWGELRGGTPGLVDGDRYLAFFHTCQAMETVQSDGRNILHYFMGAYTFALQPPFEILSMSYEPIFGPGFYEGTIYKPYWHPISAVFPCGFVFDENYIWVVYGRQDHESWMVKLDKKKLLQSLIPVSRIE